MTASRRYTWRPDLPDVRDHIYQAPLAPLPEHVDLRPGCSPVEDQGNLGSCTAQAIVGALEYLDRRDDHRYVNRSRLMLYYEERKREGTLDIDSGAMIRTGVKAATKVGVCAETLWPYRISRYREAPSKAAYADADKRRIAEYQRITSLSAMRGALAAGFPVVFGFSVYESFESARVEATGLVPMPRGGEALLGGHAVLAVGYDDPSKRVIFRNSYGPRWGMAGYGTLPYAYVTDRNLSDDFWCVRR